METKQGLYHNAFVIVVNFKDLLYFVWGFKFIKFTEKLVRRSLF